MPEKLALSIDEAAAALGVSRSALKEEIYGGRIHVKRVGRRVLIPRWALDQYLDNPDAQEAALDAEKIGRLEGN